jgi:hypothetical protein
MGSPSEIQKTLKACMSETSTSMGHTKKVNAAAQHSDYPGSWVLRSKESKQSDYEAPKLRDPTGCTTLTGGGAMRSFWSQGDIRTEMQPEVFQKGYAKEGARVSNVNLSMSRRQQQDYRESIASVRDL